ncbi:MAG: hypothetical protein JO314_10495 [Acidobacteria bacterium]|nr:hypothetical protein [Acidobacteriota bacterium]
MRNTRSIGICTVFAVLLLTFVSRAQSVDNMQWGAPVEGLQMSISRIHDDKATVPEFEVVLRNVEDKDTTLNLGIMLANGKAQQPSNISFILTDRFGKTRTAAFASVFAVAGRVDDYVVPLRAGSAYTLRLSSKHFLLTIDNAFIAPRLLSSGEYTITAQFVGGGAKATNLDTPGMKLMNYWIGTVRSNVLKVDK